MTITRNDEDYEVELWGQMFQPAEPEIGVHAEYRDVLAWSDELGGEVKLERHEEDEALRLINENIPLWRLV